MIDMPRHLAEQQVNDEAAVKRPPEIMMFCRGGTPVECRDIEQAKQAAEKFSGRHPGVVAGVYQLIGFAFVPERSGSFVDLDQLKIEKQ